MIVKSWVELFGTKPAPFLSTVPGVDSILLSKGQTRRIVEILGPKMAVYVVQIGLEPGVATAFRVPTTAT